METETDSKKKKSFLKDLKKNKKDEDGKEEEEKKICVLCTRNRPVFVVENDNMIKRIPERHLSPLLLNLKEDFQNNRMYL